MSTVLVTGFEAFDGRADNASWLAVDAVARAWHGAAHLVTAQLPVSFQGARRSLRALVAEHRPDVVICVGEAARTSQVRLERLATNLIDARIADNDGSRPVDVPVIAGAPDGLFSTLPLRAALTALEAEGLPAVISGTAGGFVCNASFFALMHLLAGTPEVRGGFVHVPLTADQVAAGQPCLPTETTARALEIVVRVSAGE